MAKKKTIKRVALLLVEIVFVLTAFVENGKGKEVNSFIEYRDHHWFKYQLFRRIRGDSLMQRLRQARSMGERIRILREAKGINQAELGNRIDRVSQTTISQWELGTEPHPRFIPLLAKALDIDVWLLVTGRSRGEALSEERIREVLKSRGIEGIEFKHIIGERIYLLRYTLGLTQKELSARIDGGEAIVSDWESGDREPRPRFIPLLAKELNIDAWLLVTGKSKEEALRNAKHIGERISLARYIKGFTQEGLADEIKGDYNAVGRWELKIGEPPPPRFIPLLAKALDIDVWLLVTGRSRGEALSEERIREVLKSRGINKIEFKHIIGERIYLLRYTLGLTREQLAVGVGIKVENVSQISNWETGTHEPYPQFIPLLAKVLDIDGWLLVTGRSRGEALSEERIREVLKSRGIEGIEFKHIIGERIYLLRYTLGLTREQLAVGVGIKVENVSQISNWETGTHEPYPRFIPLLAKALEIDGWLLVTGRNKEEALREDVIRQVLELQGEKEVTKKRVIGERIRLARYIKGMTQEELGDKIGVSRQSVIYWETGLGLPSEENIIELSRVLEIARELLRERN